MLHYLRSNRDFVFKELLLLDGLIPYSPESTYLMWIDATELKVDCPHAFFENAGVGLSNGADFAGPGFLRLNLGSSFNLLELAIARMKSAISKL